MERSYNPLAKLIDQRLSELNLSKRDLVERLGYQNLPKGLRRLQQIYSGDFSKIPQAVAGLSQALLLDRFK